MAIFIMNSTLLFIPLKHQAPTPPAPPTHTFHQPQALTDYSQLLPPAPSATKQKPKRETEHEYREKLEEEEKKEEGPAPKTYTMLMTKPPQYSLLIVLLVITTAINTADSSGDHHDLQLGFLIPTALSSSSLSSTCKGTVAECMAMDDEEEEEFQLDSEINRRILATRRYISYGALRRNYVPCSRRGASYYNCHRNGRANPYRRGCSRITRCRS